MHNGSMPKSVQIGRVPDDIYKTLRERAARAGVSLSEYLLGEIIRIAESPPVADVLRRADSRSGGAASESIREAVRAARGE